MNSEPDEFRSKSSQAKQPVKSMDIIHPKSVRAKVPSRSGTLMRSAVTKPDETALPKITTQPIIQEEDGQSVTLDPVDNLSNIDRTREIRAKTIERSELIDRFRTPSIDNEVNFVPEPVIDDGSKPNDPPTQPPQLYKPVDYSNVNSALQPSMDIFEQSLMQASAQNKPPLHKSRKSKIKLGLPALLISSLLVLLAGGVYAYDNSSKLSLYVASTKAGFQASMPSYKPSGYDIGAISVGSGIVQTTFHSNSSSTGYTINEKKTSWNNQQLLNNYVFSISSDNYETINDAGRTIYLYGSNNATWIYQGIWYIVTTNHSLSVHQLIQLASTS